jgi:hypothetical protein
MENNIFRYPIECSRGIKISETKINYWARPYFIISTKVKYNELPEIITIVKFIWL